MKLHIFNPEHDIALASGLSNFTAPHAGRQLRHDLGFLPALWAAEGDAVLVDDPVQAEHSWRRLVYRLNTLTGCSRLTVGGRSFLQWKHFVAPKDISAIDPWGWNSALRATLLRGAVDERLMPDAEALQTIRNLSHRRVAAQLLSALRIDGTVGEAVECQTELQVEALLARHGRLVMKAPWSSSGRGLRFLNPDNNFQNSTFLSGWFRNVVAAQGCVMVEPFYHKVKDFGMEFFSDGHGQVSYLGLSLFHTENGAYTGNILATEKVKRDMISHYVSVDLLDTVQQTICQRMGGIVGHQYCGPFGVDMMVVSTLSPQPSTLSLHPCVEINLRRTMGHVALAMAPADDDIRLAMRIDYNDNNYQLKIKRL